MRTASLACISNGKNLNEQSDSRCTWALIQKSIVYIGNSALQHASYTTLLHGGCAAALHLHSQARESVTQAPHKPAAVGGSVPAGAPHVPAC